VSVMAAVTACLWQTWTGSNHTSIKEFPTKIGCDGQQLFPQQSVHNILFAVKCDRAADGEAVVDSILSDLGDDVQNKLLVRGFKFNGGKDLTGGFAPRCPVQKLSRDGLQAFGTVPGTQTTAFAQPSSKLVRRMAAALFGLVFSSII
jgi:hypothetical protein